MRDWLQYLMASQVCLSLMFGLYMLLFRSSRYFQWTRIYLVATVVFSLVIPALNFELSLKTQPIAFASPYWEIDGEAGFAENGDLTAVALTGNHRTVSLISVFYYLYWTGLFLAGLLLLYRIYSLILLIRKSSKERKTNYTLVTLNDDCAPFSFFGYLFLSKKIQQLEEGKIQQIIAHEQAHIAQWHSLDVIFIELASVFFWFSPLIYFLKKSIRSVHEYLADASVTRHHSSSTYFKLVLDIASLNAEPLSNPFSAKKIKQRILFQQNQKSNHMQKLKFLTAVPIVGMLVFVFSCSTPQELSSTGKGVFTLVLDAGHGGKDTGASENNVHEKDITLALAKKIKALATDHDIHVLLTRDGDVAVPLQNRSKVGKMNYDLFISMHVNQHEDNTRSGIESYYAENEQQANSLALLEIFRNELSAGPYPFVLQDQFAKPANFAVLRTDTSPAILIETGFISNKEDLENLLSDEYTTAFSTALLTSISKYREKMN